MCILHVRSVGHGACLAVDAPCVGSNILIDCGSHESAPWAAEEFLRVYRHVPHCHAFVLSHFHYDHYNGLVWLAEYDGRRRVPVEAAYYPRFPEVVGDPAIQTNLLRCVVAFACYSAALPSRLLLGDKRHLIQRHFAQVVRQVCGCPSGCFGVAKGDVIPHGRGGYKVLWPPRRVHKNDRYGAAMQQNIEVFRAAAEEDRRLRETFEKTVESGLMEDYLTSPESRAHEDDSNFRETTDGERPDFGWHTETALGEDKADPWDELDALREDEEEMSQPARRVNRSLRSVADMFSLSLLCESRFLFLGDLRPSEIRNVVRPLDPRRGETTYHVLVSAHHGTRWHNELKKISVQGVVVSSVGGKLVRFVHPGYSRFGAPHYMTCNEGHLALPI